MPDKQWDDIHDFESEGCEDLWDPERHQPQYRFFVCLGCGRVLEQQLVSRPECEFCEKTKNTRKLTGPWQN